MCDGVVAMGDGVESWLIGVNVEVIVKVFKQLLLFFSIYFIGYYNLSLLWPFAFFVCILLNEKQVKEKEERLQTARCMAFGNEKTIILNTLTHLPAWVKFSDTDKVEWLNQTMKHLWLQVNEYAQDLVPKILEPAIQAYVSDFKFNQIKVGNTPLRIDGIKVYDPDDKRKIVMDLDISYSGDCYVTFQTFKFTGGIKDIQLHGRLRVVLTPLINRIPLIGGLQAYFMSPPQIDFEMIKITHILDIPGIRNKIKNATMNIINSRYLYPSAFSMNFTEGVNVSEVAIFRTEGILRVHVVEAKNLENKDLIGKSDPYVILKVGSIKVETPIIPNSLNPKWDFWKEFEIVPNSELKIEVWDKDEGSRDDFLGRATVDISQVAKVGQVEMPIMLQGVETGTIYLRLTWLSLSSNYADLNFTVKETLLLSPYLHTAFLMIYLDSSLNLPILSKALPSAFVELEVEKETKQTDIERENSAPMWEKGFTFLIKDPKTAVLRMSIKDEQNRNTIIGEVLFKIDNLKSEPSLELKRHTFFCNKPYAETSICCSIKLRILKNEYKDTVDENLPRKMLIKQGSSVSNKSQSQISATSGSGSDMEDETISSLGQVKVSISYSQQRQRLIIHVLELNIFEKFSNNIETYVKLIIQTDKDKNDKHKTKAIKNTSNLRTFKQQFEYLISKHDLHFSSLTLQVKVKGLFGKKLLGQSIIALNGCENLTEFTEWLNLKSKHEIHMYQLDK